MLDTQRQIKNGLPSVRAAAAVVLPRLGPGPKRSVLRNRKKGRVGVIYGPTLQPLSELGNVGAIGSPNFTSMNCISGTLMTMTTSAIIAKTRFHAMRLRRFISKWNAPQPA